MAGFNRVIIMGNLTRKPELRYTPSGTAVADLSVAVNQPKGKDKKDEVVFVDVTAWDKTAEHCCEYLDKGRPVLIEGRLKLDEWEDKDTGKKRSKLAVVAQSVTFLGSGGKQDSQEQQGQDNFDDKDEVPF